MFRLVATLGLLLLSLPCAATGGQMQQLLNIGVNLAAARAKQPGNLCSKAVISKGDSARVSQLLARVDTGGLKDELGYSPAYYAVMVDDTAQLDRLLNLGYSTSGPLGSLLNAAAYWDSVNTARLLLDRGVNPNLQNGAGGTPLLVAVSEGGPDVAVLLVHRGAHIDARTLRYARICKNREVIDLLVRVGVSSANER
jgi:ankyrin repeat protein